MDNHKPRPFVIALKRAIAQAEATLADEARPPAERTAAAAALALWAAIAERTRQSAQPMRYPR